MGHGAVAVAPSTFLWYGYFFATSYQSRNPRASLGLELAGVEHAAVERNPCRGELHEHFQALVVQRPDLQGDRQPNPQGPPRRVEPQHAVRTETQVPAEVPGADVVVNQPVVHRRGQLRAAAEAPDEVGAEADEQGNTRKVDGRHGPHRAEVGGGELGTDAEVRCAFQGEDVGGENHEADQDEDDDTFHLSTSRILNLV